MTERHREAFKELLVMATGSATLSSVEETLIAYFRQHCKVSWTESSESYRLLVAAMKHRRFDVARLLVKYGAKPEPDANSRPIIDGTPLDYAIRSNKSRLIRILLSKGCDVNFSGRMFRRPLEAAISSQCSLKIIRLLLKNGADINSCTYRFRPLQLAILTEYTEVIKLLINKGARLELYSKLPTGNFCCFDEIWLSHFEWDVDFVTSLHLAAQYSNEDIVELLLKKTTVHGVNMHTLDKNETALSIAVRRRRSKIVKLLLESGADVNARVGRDRQTALHIAVECSSEDIVDILLECNEVEVDAKDKAGMTPLALSVVQEWTQIVIVRSLLARGANPNIKMGQRRQTPLHLALENYGYGVVQLLLRYRADMNQPNAEGITPIDLALKKKFLWSQIEEQRKMARAMLLHPNRCVPPSNAATKELMHSCAQFDDGAILKVLLDRGVDIDTREESLGRTPLLFALSWGSLKAVQFLLKRKADVWVKDNDGQTAFHYAAQSPDNAKIVGWLIKQGLNVNARARNGETALHVAMHYRNVHFLRILLLKHSDKVDTTITDDFGRTPLHLIFFSQDQEAARLLLASGCNVNAQDMNGEMPLHTAIKNKDCRVVQLLLMAGADVHHRNARGMPVFHYAVHYTDIYHPIFDLLLMFGADIDCKDTSNLTTAINVLRFESNVRLRNFLDYNPVIGDEELFVEQVHKHVLKMQLVGLAHSRDDRDWNYLDRGQFRPRCEEEIERMKATSFHRNVTYYDVLTSSDVFVARFVKKDLNDIAKYNCREFPLYGGILIVRIKEALIRNSLFDLTNEALVYVLGRPLPDLVLKEVLDNMKNRDLIALIRVQNYQELLAHWGSEECEELFKALMTLSESHLSLLRYADLDSLP